jgi:hypothetical protein
MPAIHAHNFSCCVATDVLARKRGGAAKYNGCAPMRRQDIMPRNEF